MINQFGCASSHPLWPSIFDFIRFLFQFFSLWILIIHDYPKYIREYIPPVIINQGVCLEFCFNTRSTTSHRWPSSWCCNSSAGTSVPDARRRCPQSHHGWRQSRRKCSWSQLLHCSPLIRGWGQCVCVHFIWILYYGWIMFHHCFIKLHKTSNHSAIRGDGYKTMDSSQATRSAKSSTKALDASP